MVVKKGDYVFIQLGHNEVYTQAIKEVKENIIQLYGNTEIN